MKIKEILESATAGATSSASIATVPNPHLSPGKARGKKSYTGSPWTGSGTKSPPQPKPKKQKPTDNALDMKTSLFGEGNLVRRQGVAEVYDGDPDEYFVLRHRSKLDIEREITIPRLWEKIKQFDSYQEAKRAYEAMKAKYPNEKFTVTTHKKQPSEGVSEAERNEMDTPEFQRALASVKKSAAQGPKKTVYDPKTGKYKVVPVNDKKEGAYESKLIDKLNKLVENLDSAEYNDEAGMAENNLHTLARAVEGLLDTIKSNDNLPEWVQEKIAKAEMILVTVWDYLLSQKEQGIDPEIT